MPGDAEEVDIEYAEEAPGFPRPDHVFLSENCFNIEMVGCFGVPLKKGVICFHEDCGLRLRFKFEALIHVGLTPAMIEHFKGELPWGLETPDQPAWASRHKVYILEQKLGRLTKNFQDV